MDLLFSFFHTLFVFLSVLTVLVFVHELGHYCIARYHGVGVDTFSIGYGPSLFSWDDASKTKWKIGIFPLGGYVRFCEDSQDSLKTSFVTCDFFSEKKPWQKITIALAGPAANYLLAFFLLVGLFFFVGSREVSPVIHDVVPQGPAAQAGLQKGDRILQMNAIPVHRFQDIVMICQQSKGPLAIDYNRQGSRHSLVVVPSDDQQHNQDGKKAGLPFLGIQGQEVFFQKKSLVSAAASAGKEIGFLSYQTLAMIGGMIKGVHSTDNIGGPIRIAILSKEVSQQGFGAILFFMALLSVNLGLINLLPIPVLDGGHVFIYTMEGLYGGPLPPRAHEWIMRMGLVVVLFITGIAFRNDLKNLTVFQGIFSFFS